tara:strand:- start:435 stop:1358 length:924 start_codon:yes stop_codon:yes gene_type:complete
MNAVQEQKLREFIRKGITHANFEEAQSKLHNLKNEFKLRKIIKNLIKEASEVVTGGQAGDETRSTGINVLANVLKLVIPIIKQGYIQLTTSPEQRQSYRAHIIQNAINTLMRVDMTAGRATEVEMPENPEAAPAPMLAEQDMTIDVDVKDKFIDIEPEKADDAPEPEAEKLPSEEAVDALDKKEFVSLKDMDTTGMEMAQRTFPKIQKQIADGYAMLSLASDKEEFADYLVANLKLYFDQFDQESEGALAEPTSPEYDEAKEKMAKYSPEGAPVEEPVEPGEIPAEEPMALQEAHWFVHTLKKITNG